MKFSKKKIFLVISILMLVVNLCAQNAGKKITVSRPSLSGADENDKWIPLFIQGQLLSDIQNYSDFTVIDRNAAEQIMGEQALKEANSFIEEDDEKASIQYASLVDSDYIVVVNILKKSSSWALDCKILNVETSKPYGKAYSNANVTSLMLEDGSVIHTAAYELLKGAGVDEKRLSPLIQQTKKQLEQVAAQTSLAKGMIAENNGNNIEALTYYIKARKDDTNSKEILNKVNSISTAVSNGNIGQQVINLIQLRNSWDVLLHETAEMLIKNEPEFALVYINDVQLGELEEHNYTNNTANYVVSAPFLYCMNEEVGEQNKEIILTLKKALEAIPESKNWGAKINGFPWTYGDDFEDNNWLKKAKNETSEIFTYNLILQDMNKKEIARTLFAREVSWKRSYDYGRIYDYDFKNLVVYYDYSTNMGDGKKNTVKYVEFRDIPVKEANTNAILFVVEKNISFLTKERHLPLAKGEYDFSGIKNKQITTTKTNIIPFEQALKYVFTEEPIIKEDTVYHPDYSRFEKDSQLIACHILYLKENQLRFLNYGIGNRFYCTDLAKAANLLSRFYGKTPAYYYNDSNLPIGPEKVSDDQGLAYRSKFYEKSDIDGFRIPSKIESEKFDLRRPTGKDSIGDIALVYNLSDSELQERKEKCESIIPYLIKEVKDFLDITDKSKLEKLGKNYYSKTFTNYEPVKIWQIYSYVKMVNSGCYYDYNEWIKKDYKDVIDTRYTPKGMYRWIESIFKDDDLILEVGYGQPDIIPDFLYDSMKIEVKFIKKKGK